MALFRSSSDHDPDRAPRAAKSKATGRDTPARAPEAPSGSGASGGRSESGWIRPAAASAAATASKAAEVDPLADRLQSRLAAFEAEPDVKHVPRAERVAAAPTDAIADLNEQLDVLRHQLEDAFEDMDGRIAAARVRADEAHTRAEASHTRLRDIVTAINQLSAELPSLMANDRSDLDRLRVALARLKDQIDPDRPSDPAPAPVAAPSPPPADPARTTPPPEAPSAPATEPAP